MRQVKEITELNEVRCDTCIYFNEGDCIALLPINIVEPDDRCSTHGFWLYKNKLLSYVDICKELKYHDLVNKIEDLTCKFCLHYFPNREECHYSKTAHYRTQKDCWCGFGDWLFCDKQTTQGEDVILCKKAEELYRILVGSK